MCRVLLDWASENGAAYAELNYGCNERRELFWRSVGFWKRGADEWGDPLMILPPVEDIPITVEILADHDDWQPFKLENGYLQEIVKEPLTEAKREHRAVVMCSVVRVFSTFACCDTGIFEDFYIEPVFRGKVIARMLTQTALNWSRENGLASLSVTCDSCDEEMYQALGFDDRLGNTFAYII